MRKALVCISLMLALVLVWSMIFGQHDEGAAAATVARIEAQSPVRRFAVSKVMPIPAKVGAPGAGCYRRYKMPPDTAQKAIGPVEFGCRQMGPVRSDGFWRINRLISENAIPAPSSGHRIGYRRLPIPTPDSGLVVQEERRTVDRIGRDGSRYETQPNNFVSEAF